MVDLDPTAFLERLECSLVAELSRGVVFLVFREDVSKVVVAVCIVLVVAYGALVWKHRIIELTKGAVCDAQEEVYLGYLDLDHFVKDDVLTDFWSSWAKLLNVVKVLLLENQLFLLLVLIDSAVMCPHLGKLAWTFEFICLVLLHLLGAQLVIALLSLSMQAFETVTEGLLVEAESLLWQLQKHSDDVRHLEKAISQLRLICDNFNQTAEFITERAAYRALILVALVQSSFWEIDYEVDESVPDAVDLVD